ncbi:MAG: hypothetical protein ACE5I1_33065 [bacterium]
MQTATRRTISGTIRSHRRSQILERLDRNIPQLFGSTRAHHRGLAMAAMRISGHKLPNDIVFGQWQWGKLENNQ